VEEVRLLMIRPAPGLPVRGGGWWSLWWVIAFVGGLVVAVVGW